jgi:hypothetical protein
MACNHKFKSYLNLERINDFEPTTLIVGTFNPEWPETNYAEWFYGRTSNNYFWDVLPRIYGEKSLLKAGPSDWKKFCREKQIAITDLIASIEDADKDKEEDIDKLKDYSDKTIARDFKKHKLVEITELLKRNGTIKNVYFTRGISDTFWKNAWTPIETYAMENLLNEKKLLTPSKFARYQQGRYNKQNPANTLSLEDFILRDWKSKWHIIENE